MPKSGELGKACSRLEVLSLGAPRNHLGSFFKVLMPKLCPRATPSLSRGPYNFLKLDKWLRLDYRGC